ncbi:aminopeptidase P family protein [Thermaerobacter sp. PB12/4term]|nr:aminopeptidase P family protein [Thermaerobacter sp. PB12/4term]
MARGVDVVVVMPGANLLYTFGFKGKVSERIMLGFLPTRGEPVLLLPELELPSVREVSPWQNFRTYKDEEGPAAALRQVAAELKLAGACLGVEYGVMRLLEFRLLQDVAGSFNTVDASKFFAAARVCKDAAELDSLREAVAIVETALERVLPEIRPGRKEVEIAARLEMVMRELGSEGTPFGTIVASGYRGALPHGRASAKTIEEGELVILDFGAIYKGYVADITRTVAVGRVSDELRHAYQVVYEAQRRAREGVAPGRTAGEIDALARDYITEAGYGSYFSHRTGHGLGLDAHEEPYIMKGNQLRLQPGMTFTVEPGIYLPGQGGIRIEDDVVVTEQGFESITRYPRELMEL